MGTLGFLVLVVIILLFFRRLIIRVVLLAIVAAFAYSVIANQVRQTATGIPSQLLGSVKDTVNEYLAEGGKIMKPLVGAAAEGVELYEYCLADVTWVRGNVNPYACQALSGSERTACFEKQLASIQSYDGIADRSQIDDLKTTAKLQCNARFNVQDGMSRLLGAGARGVGELYGYCQVPGACEESNLDNGPYRECLADKLQSPPAQGLGLTKTYCGVFTTVEDREKWRKCVEVSMIQQTAGFDLALQPNDPNQPGVRAIRACRQL